MHTLGHGVVGAAVAAWPAVALAGSYELLMMIIRGAQSSEEALDVHDWKPGSAASKRMQGAECPVTSPVRDRRSLAHAKLKKHTWVA